MPTGEPNPGLARVGYELRASGVQNPEANPLRSGVHTRGYLPHVKREGATYFVTYRLADSLPKGVLLRLEAERAERLRALFESKRASKPPLEDEETINRDFRRKIERELDLGHGACYLRRPEIGELVARNLCYFEGHRYVLREWVVMPNHVHVLVWPMPNFTLSEILKSWKQYTSTRANQWLQRQGHPFWQRESYDHWVRDEQEQARIARYIRNNPVSARLCLRPQDWPWTSARAGSPT